MELIKVLSNPIKFRILQYMQEQEMATTKQIAEKLSDVPTATLYRHVNAMVKDEILTVKAENRIRGSVERILAVNTERMVNVQNEDVARSSYEFLMGLYAQFQKYAAQKECDPVRDMLSMRTCMLSLRDEDFLNMMKAIGTVLETYQQKEDKVNGKLRSISTISAPAWEVEK